MPLAPMESTARPRALPAASSALKPTTTTLQPVSEISHMRPDRNLITVVLPASQQSNRRAGVTCTVCVALITRRLHGKLLRSGRAVVAKVSRAGHTSGSANLCVATAPARTSNEENKSARAEAGDSLGTQ